VPGSDHEEHERVTSKDMESLDSRQWSTLSAKMVTMSISQSKTAIMMPTLPSLACAHLSRSSTLSDLDTSDPITVAPQIKRLQRLIDDYHDAIAATSKRRRKTYRVRTIVKTPTAFVVTLCTVPKIKRWKDGLMRHSACAGRCSHLPSALFLLRLVLTRSAGILLATFVFAFMTFTDLYPSWIVIVDLWGHQVALDQGVNWPS
jgi:hypothetical protein